MLTAKNENELISLLKIISEEAVSFSKEKLKEEKDPYTSYFDSRLESEKQRLFEEEEDAKDTQAEPDEEESVQPQEVEDEEAEAPEASGEAEPEKTGTLGSSLETLEKSINLMRSGRSLKDSQISNQLEVYYDRLEEDERNVLSLFIRELSSILAGNIQGTDAADPSDPPPEGLNVNITSRDEEAPEQEASPTEEPESETPEPEAPAEDEEEAAGADEDTTPPIKVNESQDVKQLRRKIRKLFLS